MHNPHPGQTSIIGKIPLDPASALILLIGTILGKTWRPVFTGVKQTDPFDDKGAGVIYCFWHSHILPLTYIFRDTGKIAIVSISHDGRRAAAVAQRWKHRIVGGSSSRGGASAMRACAELLKCKENIVMTPDGPRGPREIVKPGVAQLALLADAPVIAVTARPIHAWRLRSWDKFMIPKPFSKINIRLGEPVIPHGCDIEILRKKIQDQLLS